MTLINLLSSYIYSKGSSIKNKIQMYGIALIFLAFLYHSPAGLCFYWPGGFPKLVNRVMDEISFGVRGKSIQNGELFWQSLSISAPKGTGITASGAMPSIPQDLAVRINGLTRLVHTRDIFYIESAGRKVNLHAKDETIEYYARIGALEKMLSGVFYRIHKGYLVNLRYVDRFDRTSLRMKNGDTLLISRQKYPGLALRFSS